MKMIRFTGMLLVLIAAASWGCARGGPAGGAVRNELRLMTINVWSGLDYKGTLSMGEYESGDVREKRFRALAAEIRRLSPDIIGIYEANPLPDYDPRRIEVLKAFIRTARDKGALVVLAFSPTVQPLSPKVEQILAWYEDLARTTETPFIKITSAEYPQFLDQSLYSDLIHMNEPGGRTYTPIFVNKLKPLIGLKGH